jgi:TMEM175 potassium channel family protein
MRTLHLFLKRAHTHDRLCAVADGVYAIALTLLVLDLKVPDVPGITNPQLRADLLQQIPNFIAYVIGFLVVAFFWMNHHRIFQSATMCDEKALLLNLAHLLFVSLTPYAASLIGHYEGERIATILLSANLGLASLSLIALGQYVLGKEEWRTNDAGGTWVKVPWWSVYTGPFLALLSILVSFVSIDTALFLWLLLPVRDLVLLGQGSPS